MDKDYDEVFLVLLEDSNIHGAGGGLSICHCTPDRGYARLLAEELALAEAALISGRVAVRQGSWQVFPGDYGSVGWDAPRSATIRVIAMPLNFPTTNSPAKMYSPSMEHSLTNPPIEPSPVPKSERKAWQADQKHCQQKKAEHMCGGGQGSCGSKPSK